MKIQILGAGCPKCKKLFENVSLAVKELEISCEIEKVEDIEKIIELGVMMTPALVINGTVKSVGKLVDVETIKTFIKGT